MFKYGNNLHIHNASLHTGSEFCPLMQNQTKTEAKIPHTFQLKIMNVAMHLKTYYYFIINGDKYSKQFPNS